MSLQSCWFSYKIVDLVTKCWFLKGTLTFNEFYCSKLILFWKTLSEIMHPLYLLYFSRTNAMRISNRCDTPSNSRLPITSAAFVHGPWMHWVWPYGPLIPVLWEYSHYGDIPIIRCSLNHSKHPWQSSFCCHDSLLTTEVICNSGRCYTDL